MVEEQATTNRWVGRPWLARTVRAAVYVVPFVFSVVGAFVLSQAIPPAPNVALAVLRVFAITAGATVVMRVVDSLTRRALPLATLFDLTLVFPDQAPSRFKVALRGGASNVDLKQQLETYQKMGADEPAAAAEQLLELVGALSRHDRLTRGHSERVRAYAQMIGKEMGLSGDDLDKLRWAGLIHDIGKLKIDPAILNKPGKLTAEEYEIIKTHPDLGAELARPLAAWLGPSVRAVSEHHEKWDGTGYPRGLRGTDISLAARIVAVADVFDVMTSVRSYKAARPASEARAELARCAGTHFDPAVVRAFMSLSLGRLRLAMGPLSWFTQLSLFPQQLLASASAGGSGMVSTTMSAGASVASSAGAGASAAALTVAAASTGMAAGGPLMSHQYDTYQAPQAVPAAVVPAESQPAAPGDPIVLMAPTSTASATATTVLGGTSLGVGSGGVILGSSGAPAATLPQSAAAPGAPVAASPTTTTTTIAPEQAAPLPQEQQQSGDEEPQAAPAAAPTTTTGRRPTTTTTTPRTTTTTTPRTTTTTTPRTTTTTAPRATTTTAPRTTTTTAPRTTTTTTTKKNSPATTAAPTTTVPPTVAPTVAPTSPAVVVSTPVADAAVLPAGAVVSVPAPATTVAPTPSMTGTWLLTSSAPGDVASTAVLGFAQRDPLNASVVNLDTDRNSAPGRTIVKGGWTYFGSTSKVQRFAYDPGTAFNVNGRVQLDLWAAPAEGSDRKVKIVAVLAKCDDSGNVCLPVKDAGESFRGTAGTFQQVTLDFGNRSISVGQTERLELWVFASDSSDSDLVISYDTVGSASALRIS